MVDFFLEDDNSVKSTNDFIMAYMKTLPLPFKHFVVYSLKEGINWGPFTLEEIAEKFNISILEVTTMYEETKEMLKILNSNLTL